MKRATLPVAILMALGVLAGAGVAKSAPPRNETHIYNGSRGGNGTDETNLQHLVFSPTKWERFALIRVEDSYSSSENVALTVAQDVDGDGEPEREYRICGASTKPLRIAAGVEINVTVEMMGCDGGLGATMGYVEMLYFSSKGHAAQ